MSHFELLFTRDFAEAKDELESLGARVIQKFTDVVFEATVPEGFDAAKLEASSPTAPGDLDEIAELVVTAWRGLAAEQKAAVHDPLKGQLWGAKGLQRPRNAYNDPDLRPAGSQSRTEGMVRFVPPATRSYMTGSVAVGVVIVSGSEASQIFSLAEQSIIVMKVMLALQFLSTCNPLANLSFNYSIRPIDITAAAEPQCDGYEACESVWRNPALEKLGYPESLEGCQAFADALKDQTESDWSYVAFFTKYKQKWFAYASGCRLCMIGVPDPAVFAHETCHIFGAADEYKAEDDREKKCTCGPSGFYEVPNNNCYYCTTSQIDCLMVHGSPALCRWTEGQIGWSFWEPIWGNLSGISAASDGTVWGVNEAGVFRYVGGKAVWENVPDKVMSKVAVGSASNIWGINDLGTWRYLGEWVPIGGFLSDISAASDGTVWGVTSDGVVRYVAGRKVWDVVGITKMSKVAVGSASNIWGINGNGVFQYAFDDDWIQLGGNVTLTDIAVGADGTVWGVNLSGTFRYDSDDDKWQQIPGDLSYIAVGNASQIWGINSAGTFRRRVLATV